MTEAHLKATAVSEDHLKEMLDTALKGEQDLIEPEGSDERLLRLLGLRESEKKKQTEVAKDKEIVPPTQGRKLKPGNRAPTRDPIGSGSNGQLPECEEEKGQIAG